MVKIRIFYPNKPGSRFDVDYYLNTHMPMAARLLGGGVKAVTVEIGLRGTPIGEQPLFAAIAGFTCDTVDDFMQVFMPVSGELQGDIPKYTDIEPVIQFSQFSEVAVG